MSRCWKQFPNPLESQWGRTSQGTAQHTSLGAWNPRIYVYYTSSCSLAEWRTTGNLKMTVSQATVYNLYWSEMWTKEKTFSNKIDGCYIKMLWIALNINVKAPTPMFILVFNGHIQGRMTLFVTLWVTTISFDTSSRWGRYLRDGMEADDSNIEGNSW